MAQLGHYMGCASASGVSVDRCLRFPSCMVFVSFGTVRCSSSALASFRYRTVLWTAPFTSLNRSCCVYLCTFVFTSLTPGSRGPSVKSLFRCARYTVCSFVFLFRLFPVFVSVLRVCLPLTASPAAFFRNGPNQVPILSSELHAPQSSGPDQYPESFLPGVPTPNCSAGPRTFSFPSIQEVLHLPQAFPAKSAG